MNRYDVMSQTLRETLRRRDFIRLIAGSSATWPLVARGQVSIRRPLIAVLTAITKENNSPLNALVSGWSNPARTERKIAAADRRRVAATAAVYHDVAPR